MSENQKKIWITGASSGIGKALAEKFAAEGWKVAASARRKEILDKIHGKGYHQLYIDGGKTIQSFLKEDLIDEITITIIPYLLGGGIPLFAELPNRLAFECIDTKIYLDKVVQNHFMGTWNCYWFK